MFRRAGTEIFLSFEADLDFSRPSFSEIKVQIKWLNVAPSSSTTEVTLLKANTSKRLESWCPWVSRIWWIVKNKISGVWEVWWPMLSVISRKITALIQNHHTHILPSKQYAQSTYPLWHFRLWSFQGRDTKLERFLAKNQRTQRKFLNFENWTYGEPQ